MRMWWTLREKVEVEYKKRFFRTYICPISPTYRDKMYMYLGIVERALAGVPLSKVGQRIFEVRTYLQM